MCDKKYYTLRLKCMNCDNEWEGEIEFGKQFVAYSLARGAYYAEKGDKWDAEYITCPNCGTGKVVKAEKAATCEVQVGHARESWPGYGSPHVVLQVNEGNAVMAEKWRQYLAQSPKPRYAYEICAEGEPNTYYEVCSIVGRQGKGREVTSAFMHIRPIVEAVVHLENTIGTDERLFLVAMNELRTLLIKSGLAKVKEPDKCNPTQE